MHLSSSHFFPILQICTKTQIFNVRQTQTSSMIIVTCDVKMLNGDLMTYLPYSSSDKHLHTSIYFELYKT